MIVWPVAETPSSPGLQVWIEALGRQGDQHGHRYADEAERYSVEHQGVRGVLPQGIRGAADQLAHVGCCRPHRETQQAGNSYSPCQHARRAARSAARSAPSWLAVFCSRVDTCTYPIRMPGIVSEAPDSPWQPAEFRTWVPNNPGPACRQLARLKVVDVRIGPVLVRRVPSR